MSTPREVIADIRRLYRADLPPAEDEDLRVGMAGRLLPLVTNELYESDTHFFRELLQNADDNSYSSAVVPSLTLIAMPDSLVLVNNETGFEEAQVRAVCDAAKSTKKDRKHFKEGMTGEKGIGFKAVFQVSDRPEVHSNGYHFRFDKNKHRPFGTVIPEWIEGVPDVAGTRIVLPLRKGYHLPPDFLKNLQPELLLFLRRIKRFEFQDKDYDRSLVLDRTDEGATVTVARTVIDNVERDKSAEQRHRFRVHAKRVSMMDIHEERRPNIEATEVTIAFALDADGTVDETRDRDLFAFLPIKNSGFKFLAHADFVSATSREGVQEGLPWNVRLRDSLGDCLAEAILSYRTTPSPGATALRVIADPTTASDMFLGGILSRAIELLITKECVPTIGGAWVCPAAAVITDRGGLWRLVPESDAATILAKGYVKPGIDRIDQPLGRLGVGRFSLESLLTCIGNVAWRKGRTAGWFGALYGRLGGARLNEGQIESLRRAPILRLETGDTAAPANSTVFRSLSDDVRYGFESELDLLAPETLSSIPEDEHKSSQELLNRLGVSDATPTAVIERHILKVHAGPDWGNRSDDILLGHAHYVRDHMQAYLNGKPHDKREAAKGDLASKLKVRRMVETKDLRYGAVSVLYLGSAYRDPHDIEGLFGKTIVDTCVSSHYLTRGHTDGPDAALNAWRDMFIALGAHTLPRVFWSGDKRDYEWAAEVATVLGSTDDASKLRLLAIVDKHWDSRYSAWKDRPKGASAGPSKMLLALRAMQVPTNSGPCALGDGYVSSDDNRAVFGTAVPYLTVMLSANFANALGITVAPTIGHALARLDEVRQTVPDIPFARSIVGPLYLFLNLRFEQHAAEVKTAFSTKQLILADAPEGGTWATTEDCCWTLPRELRPFSPMAGLSLWWRDLQGFFCEKLGVADAPSPDSLVDALVALAEAELTPDQTTRVARAIYGRLRYSAAEIDENAADAAVWLQRLRGELLIWTKDNAWWRNDDDVFAADDLGIETLFERADSVAFVHLPPEELTSHADLLRLLGIQTLSDAIQTRVPDDVASEAWTEFKERLGERMHAIARFLHHKHAKVLDAAVTSGAFDSLSALDAHRCTPLELEVTLNTEHARHPFEARLIVEQGRHSLFVDASADNSWESVGIEIGRLLGLADTESLPIGTLLEKRSLADAERFLETLRVAQLPPDVAMDLFDEGDDVSQVPPDDDVTQSGATTTDEGTAPGASEVSDPQAGPGNDDGDENQEEGESSDGKQSDVAGSPAVAETSTGTAVTKATADGATGAVSGQGEPSDNETEAGGPASVNGRAESTEQKKPHPGSRQPAEDHDGDDVDESPEDGTSSDGSDAGDSRDTGAAGDSGRGRGTRGGQHAGDDGSHAGRAGAGRPPTKPDAPGRSRSPKPRSVSTNEQMRSYVSKDREPDDDDGDGAATEEHDQIGAAAIRHVLAWERQQERDPTDENEANPQNEGYDISSRGPSGEVERYIEVKGVKGEWGLRGVAVTPPQFKFAETQGQQAWLYVVEFALTDAPRIHRIQDFARRVWRFMFDDGWRDISESANLTTWPEAVVGMKVRLPDGRTGSVKRVFGAGQNQGVDVGLDTGDEVIRVPWQPARVTLILDEETS